MSWEMHQILLGFHILLAIIWVGGVLFVGWGVFPAARKLALAAQQLFLISLMLWTHWLFTLAGIGVIATGILLGTVLGPLRSWQAVWNTSYGNIWLTALIIALFTLAWGVFIGYRQSMKVFSDKTLWENAENGNTKPLTRALTITALVESVEVLGFLALIVCMVLL